MTEAEDHDFIVDRLEEVWPVIQEKYGADILTINADNGMENSSSRTQFIKRLVEFADQYNITINFAESMTYNGKSPIVKLTKKNI
ncbi:hypothetical protein VU04_12395 [Desulfobulbus sp. TB]|nr:hypothetical protein [Desulfobulbus sp. TB]